MICRRKTIHIGSSTKRYIRERSARLSAGRFSQDTRSKSDQSINQRCENVPSHCVQRPGKTLVHSVFTVLTGLDSWIFWIVDVLCNCYLKFSQVGLSGLDQLSFFSYQFFCPAPIQKLQLHSCLHNRRKLVLHQQRFHKKSTVMTQLIQATEWKLFLISVK